MDDLLIDSIDEAKVLGILKNIYNDYSDSNEKNKLRNILAISLDKKNSINQIVIRKYGFKCNDLQCERLLQLVNAFLKKSEYRKKIDDYTKNQLLKRQKYQCAICKKNINISDHADHIVPFKFVGDELDDNLQMLCSTCNEKKNDSIDYQIRFLLKLV